MLQSFFSLSAIETIDIPHIMFDTYTYSLLKYYVKTTLDNIQICIMDTPFVCVISYLQLYNILTLN